MEQAAVLAPPTKSQRTEAFRKASWAERVAMHEAIAAHKSAAIEARRAIGRRYLAEHDGACVVPPGAVTFLDLAAETAAVRAEAIALTEGRASQASNGSLEFPVLAQDFRADSEGVRLGVSPLILAPIVRYCGMMPILFNMFVTRAATTELLQNSAHLFHLDPEDVISFKVFVHLTDVDDDCGPFHALPADRTQHILDTVGYHGIGRLTDAEVDRLVGWDAVVRVVGPAGTVAFADTTRCLHFGGRPRAPGKPLRDMLVYQYLLPTSLLFPIDGDGKQPRFFPQLEATGDETWDALIGARFV